MRTISTLQRHAATKLSFKTLVASFALCAVFSNAGAQPFGPNCTSTQIDISTGLNSAGSLIPYPAAGSTQDPFWTVTMVPNNTIGLTPPFCAELLDATSGGARPVQGGAHYISFATTPTVANLGAGSGFFWTYHHGTVPPGPLNQSLPTRFTRQFYIEGGSPQTVTIDISGFGDDIHFIAVDATPGVPIFNTPANPNNVYYAAGTSTTLVPMAVTGYTITLSPGVHTIDVDMYDISGVISCVSLNGTLTVNTPLLAENTCYGHNMCRDIEVPDECDDICYWTVHGNNIQYNRNNFGTMSDDDINIISNATMRGIITTGGAATGDAKLGWNTMSPTSILHVNCDGNHPDGSGQSDVRFENLESGTGYVLVIDDQGHVFRTRYRIEDIIRGDGTDGAGKSNIYNLYEEEKAKREQLETKLQQVLLRMDAIEGCCKGTDGHSDGLGLKSLLYQNTPNPFSKETNISYDIRSMKYSAYIAVYDVKGLEITRQDIGGEGSGSVTIRTERMVSGTYTYSLVVDGQLVDTKKMIFTKE